MMKKFVLFVGLVSGFILLAQFSNAANNGLFNVDPDYDISGRSEISAVLIKTTPTLYFFIEKNWWESQNATKQSEILSDLDSLSQEFQNHIYPNLTSVFGQEWKPGIDGDERITILLHLMKEGVGGYFRTTDEYLKLQISASNEREMLYLPIGQIENTQLKTFLAHEFTHLITFNQKNKKFNIEEEIWLNEARAEYAITMLGYDQNYEGSNLQRRVGDFLERPSDSLTEWQDRKYDYGSAGLFIQYLADHYGTSILSESLKSRLIGIASLNEALINNGFEDDFSDIFTNWTIAVFLNDCQIGPKYCYLSENLANLKISPNINFIPLSGQSSLSVTDLTKNWAGNWQKFIGGNGVLKFEFKGSAGLNFKIPYLIQDKAGNFSIDFLPLDKNQGAQISIPDFGTENRALFIIPSLQSKTSGFNGLEFTYPFTFTVSTVVNPADDPIIQQLLAQIEFLKQEIARVQAQINAILGRNSFSCSAIQNNIFVGVAGPEVRCLQEVLRAEGANVYPEGLITGYFGPLTQSAVIRFQEKYTAEILSPSGLNNGTGYVGPSTRAKLNRILSGT